MLDRGSGLEIPSNIIKPCVKYLDNVDRCRKLSRHVWSLGIFFFEYLCFPVGSPGCTRKVGCLFDGMQDSMRFGRDGACCTCS